MVFGYKPRGSIPRHSTINQLILIMAQIEYRGKTITSGKWVYGDLLHFGRSRDLIVNGEVGSSHDVARMTIGQFTHLFDCEGKPIYEGDILRWGECNYLVGFSAGAYRVMPLKSAKPARLLCELTSSECKPEIIGNGEDNPNYL